MSGRLRSVPVTQVVFKPVTQVKDACEMETCDGQRLGNLQTQRQRRRELLRDWAVDLQKAQAPLMKMVARALPGGQLLTEALLVTALPGTMPLRRLRVLAVTMPQPQQTEKKLLSRAIAFQFRAAVR